MVPEKIIKKQPIPCRIQFTKTGSLQYISHLDLNRTMQRVILRAKLPVWYTEGFNPKPKLVFAAPLSVGCESDCEYMDIRLVEEMDSEEVVRRLTAALPCQGEMLIRDVYQPQTKFTDIAYAEYDIVLYSDAVTEDLPEKAEALFKKPLVVLRRTKSGEKECDITPMVKSLTAELVDDGRKALRVRAVLSADSQNYLNPEYVAAAIAKEYSLDAKGDYYTMKRVEFFKEDGETAFR